jgi:TolA-binding protein
MEQSKNKGITREDIRAYRSTTNEQVRYSIEKRSLEDDFDADALEGWNDPALTESSLKRLDKKFTGKNYFSLFIAGASVVIVATVAVIFFNTVSNTDKPVLSEERNIEMPQVERTDIVLPESIEKMEELPESKQIRAITVIKEFEEQKEILEQQPTKAEDRIHELPVNKIESPTAPEKPVRETIFGKEIYLSELKALDYRAYRSKPSIQTKQLELTGTPADQGEPGQKAEEEFTWKTIDIPYIEYLEKSMDIFSRGNNKKALARFEEIIRTYPDDINALFYAGLCYYNLNQFDKAASAFEKCVESKYINFNEEAYWYLAKSLLAGQNPGRAKEILQEIRDAGGYYSKQADKLLKY